jgi:hypothetical protein
MSNLQAKIIAGPYVVIVMMSGDEVHFPGGFRIFIINLHFSQVISSRPNFGHDRTKMTTIATRLEDF